MLTLSVITVVIKTIRIPPISQSCSVPGTVITTFHGPAPSHPHGSSVRQVLVGLHFVAEMEGESACLAQGCWILNIKGYSQDLNPGSLTPELMFLIILLLTLHTAHDVFNDVFAVPCAESLLKS